MFLSLLERTRYFAQGACSEERAGQFTGTCTCSRLVVHHLEMFSLRFLLARQDRIHDYMKRVKELEAPAQGSLDHDSSTVRARPNTVCLSGPNLRVNKEAASRFIKSALYNADTPATEATASGRGLVGGVARKGRICAMMVPCWSYYLLIGQAGSHRRIPRQTNAYTYRTYKHHMVDRMRRRSRLSAPL